MILYYGTYTPRVAFRDMTTYTDSIVEAAAFAKLACDKAGVPVDNARIYVISVESWQAGNVDTVNRGNKRYRFSFGYSVAEHSYADLREVLNTNGWAMLHSDTEYLKRFLGVS